MFAPVAAGPGRHEPTLLIRRAPALAAQRLLAKHAGELSCQLAQRSQVVGESPSVVQRRQKRHLTRLKELAAEFGFPLPPVRYDLSVAPPVFPLPKGSSQAVEPRLHFNEPVPSGQDSVPAPRRSLAEELRRRTKMITATAMRPLTAISSNPLAPDVSASERDPCAVQLIGFVGAAVPSGCRHRQGCTLGRTDSRSCTRLRCCGPRRYRGCF